MQVSLPLGARHPSVKRGRALDSHASIIHSFQQKLQALTALGMLCADQMKRWGCGDRRSEPPRPPAPWWEPPPGSLSIPQLHVQSHSTTTDCMTAAPAPGLATALRQPGAAPVLPRTWHSRVPRGEPVGPHLTALCQHVTTGQGQQHLGRRLHTPSAQGPTSASGSGPHVAATRD